MPGCSGVDSEIHLEASRGPVQVFIAETKKATERWLLDRVASQKMALSLSKFRAPSTSIRCMPGRNQQYQSVERHEPDLTLSYLFPLLPESVGRRIIPLLRMGPPFHQAMPCRALYEALLPPGGLLQSQFKR
jgi:hypothetical protein